MSLFNFTRQEQIVILFLTFTLLVGGIVTLIKRHWPDFAPELVVNTMVESLPGDTVVTPQTPEPSTSPDSLLGRRVNINDATLEELMELPGIGPKMAQRIMAHRTQHGAFQTLEDLKSVKGIGDKTLERLRPLIKFE
jgi:competence protein ComEA